ncbi:MAG: hypothetical protein ABJA61_03365 [Caldimonas sp.]
MRPGKQKAARRRLSQFFANLYFVAALAAIMADEAASIAEEAAIAADPEASEDADIVGATTTAAGAGIVVVVVSSFLLQAAKEMAAAIVTISNAVFIFLLDFKVRTITGNCGNPLVEEPHRVRRQGTHEHSFA